jgi:hypothetical protein
MHSQLQAWHDGFQRQAEEARALAAPLSEAAFNAPGPGGGWSAGQCLGHLLQAGEPLVESLYVALERARVRGRRAAPPFRYGWMGRWLIRGVTPGSRAVPTVPAYRPAQRYDRDETLRRFQQLQARLSDFVAQAEGFDLGWMRAPSPALPLMRLKAAAWLEATLHHQQRHLDQARQAGGEA